MEEPFSVNRTILSLSSLRACFYTNSRLQTHCTLVTQSHDGHRFSQDLFHNFKLCTGGTCYKLYRISIRINSAHIILSLIYNMHIIFHLTCYVVRYLLNFSILICIEATARHMYLHFVSITRVLRNQSAPSHLIRTLTNLNDDSSNLIETSSYHTQSVA